MLAPEPSSAAARSAGVISTPHTQTRDATDDLALIIASALISERGELWRS